MDMTKYIGKTVFYLKAAEDGFHYLAHLDVFAISATHFFNKDFTKSVAFVDTFENYKDAQEYMNAIGVELYATETKVGFKTIYPTGSDVR